MAQQKNNPADPFKKTLAETTDKVLAILYRNTADLLGKAALGLRSEYDAGVFSLLPVPSEPITEPETLMDCDSALSVQGL